MSSSTSAEATFSWQTTDFLTAHYTPTSLSSASTSHLTHPRTRSGDGTESGRVVANGEGKRKQALIILNQPITRHDTLERLWSSCDIKLCADGGANRLHDHLLKRSLIRQFPSGHRKYRPSNTSDPVANSSTNTHKRDDSSKQDETERQSSYYIEKEMFEERKWLPDMIKGDLDSLRGDVRQYYESMGVRIEEDKDEYSTDLMKCVREVESLDSPVPERANRFTHAHRIIILGGLSGRLDQTIHTLAYVQKLATGRSTTFGAAESNRDEGVDERRRKERDVRVVSEDCVAWVLDAGHHLIHVDHQVFGQTCGILPLGVEVANVKTSGLKWNLDWPTSFSADISTSNHLLPEEPIVRLRTDKPVWWTMEIKDPLM